jgi:hypothetical protein
MTVPGLIDTSANPLSSEDFRLHARLKGSVMVSPRLTGGRKVAAELSRSERLATEESTGFGERLGPRKNSLVTAPGSKIQQIEEFIKEEISKNQSRIKGLLKEDRLKKSIVIRPKEAKAISFLKPEQAEWAADGEHTGREKDFADQLRDRTPRDWVYPVNQAEVRPVHRDRCDT